MSCHRRSWKHASAAIGFGILTLADPALAADIPLKAPGLKAVYDWTGFYFGAHAGFSRGSSNVVLSDPTANRTGNVFDGMIGGVQAGYNYRLPSGLSVRRRGRLLVSELFHLEPGGLNHRNPALGCRRIVGLRGDRARPRRIRERFVAGLCHRRIGLGGRALRQHARHRQRGKGAEHTARLGRGRRRRIRFRAALERAAGISLQPIRPCRRHLPVGNEIRLDARFPIAARRSQPQDRLAGGAHIQTRDVAERSRIRSLGNSRPDHVPAARLSRLPCAL